jgi:hypothetical protein
MASVAQGASERWYGPGSAVESSRGALMHLLEETARHAGHDDIAVS